MEYLQENYPEKKLGTTSLYYWIREKMGMTYRKKRPKNESSSDKDVESFKTELPNVLDTFEEKIGTKPRLFFMDEHRMGLQPILRKQWLFPRERYQKIHIGYSWLWVYGFVEPNTGENHHYLFGNLNSTCFEKSLDTFAKSTNVSRDNPIVLILDGAAAHRAKTLKIPEGIHFHFLPPYSPELQPAERLWPMINESIANSCIRTFSELFDKVTARCKWMMSEGVTKIKGLTNYHWLLNTT
jgi:hypothetical protein